MKVWPYSPDRVNENRAGKELVTEKQVGYILHLSKRRNDDDEQLNEIMDSIPGDLDIEDLSKGQAMYVIKCLMGEIKKVEITPDIKKRVASDNT